MKLWVKNTILAVILVLIIAVPLLFMGGLCTWQSNS